MEAASAREELKGARKDLLHMRSEGSSLRALYDLANSKAAEQSAQADEQIAALIFQLSEAEASMAGMVPKGMLEAARQEAAGLHVGCLLVSGQSTPCMHR